MREHDTPDSHSDDLGKPVPPTARDEFTEPNPHASGDAALPENQEPLGVGAAMFQGVGNEATAYSTDDPEALEEAMKLGVEHEGIESAQLVGLMMATVIAIAVLVVTVFAFVISPTIQGAQAAAEQEELYPELLSVRASGLARINDYAVESAEEGTYRIPIEDARRLVARAYGMRQEGVTGLRQPPELYTLGGVTATPAEAVMPAARQLAPNVLNL